MHQGPGTAGAGGAAVHPKMTKFNIIFLAFSLFFPGIEMHGKK